MFGKLEVHVLEVMWRFELITFYIGESRVKLILDIDDDEWFRLRWNMNVLIKQRLLEFNIWASWASFLGQLAQLYR